MLNIVIRKIKYYINLILFNRNWRRKNKHNFTTAGNIFSQNKVSVGKRTYGRLNVKTYGNEKEKLEIGSYCSIAGDVKFLLGGEHSYRGLSTYPFKKYICGIKEDTISKGPIVIEDDVWIGENSIILSGVTIGQGSVIAAGSIIAKDIPPYAIYAGGEIKKYRFPKEIVEKLLKFDFSKINEEAVISNIDIIYKNLTFETIEIDLQELRKKCGEVN